VDTYLQKKDGEGHLGGSWGSVRSFWRQKRVVRNGTVPRLQDGWRPFYGGTGPWSTGAG
jgi:hypothetical protein